MNISLPSLDIPHTTGSEGSTTMKKDLFHVGDKVKIWYISDCNPHNGKVGTITWLHEYNFYPSEDFRMVEKKVQGTIAYEDGKMENISDFYRKGCGIVSPVIKVVL